MTRRIASWIFLAAIASGPFALRGDATDVINVSIRGRYFAAPATVHVTVAVEPHADNRLLRIEVEGDDLFRSSEYTLSGANEKRLHSLYYKNLPAGSYVLRAAVASSTEVRGFAEQAILVSGVGAQ